MHLVARVLKQENWLVITLHKPSNESLPPSVQCKQISKSHVNIRLKLTQLSMEPCFWNDMFQFI